MDVEACRQAGWELVSSRLTSEGDTVSVFRSAVVAPDVGQPDHVAPELDSNPVHDRWLAARAEWLTLGLSRPQPVDQLVAD